MGELPTDADIELGKCSQMAIFVRLDMLQLLNSVDTPAEAEQSIDESDTEVVFPIEKFEYELLFHKEFPYDQDSRSLEEKILDDVKYFINRHLYDDDPYFDYEKNICEFPVEDIFRYVHDASDLDELRKIIRKEFVINDKDCIEHKLPQQSGSEYSDYNSDDDKDEADKENDDGNRVVATTQQDEDDWN